VEVILLAVAMLVGILMQTIAGYYHYELLQYFKELYVVTFPQVLAFTLLAMFVQTIVSNKFVGHGIVIGIFVSDADSVQLRLGEYALSSRPDSPYTYSDMNGYGHFVPALFWATAYWLAIFAFFGVLSIAYARRGSDDSLSAPAPVWLCAALRGWRRSPCCSAVIAAGSGGWYLLQCPRAQ
jgi:ABC-2 type transport system permease protein